MGAVKEAVGSGSGGSERRPVRRFNKSEVPSAEVPAELLPRSRLTERNYRRYIPRWFYRRGVTNIGHGIRYFKIGDENSFDCCVS